MSFCPHCGAEVNGGFFCAQCGAQLTGETPFDNTASGDFNPYTLGNQTVQRSSAYDPDDVDPGFWGGYAACWRKYSCSRGRASRGEYWGFNIVNTLIMFVWYAALFIFFSVLEDLETIGVIVVIIGTLYAFATVLPAINAAVRRLHDQDRSGWFFLLAFIPYIGGLILAVFLLFPPTQGPNQYGPQPMKKR